MPIGPKTIKMLCPKCNERETTVLDEDTPPETALVELGCPACLEADDSLSMEPIYRDRYGVRITSLPRRT